MGARNLAVAVAIVMATAGAGALANQNQERRERDEQRNDRGGIEEAKTVHSISIAAERGQILIESVLILSNTGQVTGAVTRGGVRRVDEDRVDLGGVPLIGGLFGDGEDEYDDEEGPPRVRIGHAYLVGNSLAVDISAPTAADPGQTPGLRLDDVLKGEDPTASAIEARIVEVSDQSPDDVGIDYDWQDTRFEIDEVRLLNASYSYRMEATQFVNVGYVENAPAGTESGGGKVPILGDIPLLGNLFKHRAGDAYLEGRRLVVLIRPSILEDDYE